ncbi:hypothetical protein B0H10DRAFT_2206749 [Mycena sp. CBHHK59/15]|nr:hypothetical protein B0H10DRAFT_2206749 [Mycena sp. CBHHK59/15]
MSLSPPLVPFRMLSSSPCISTPSLPPSRYQTSGVCAPSDVVVLAIPSDPPLVDTLRVLPPRVVFHGHSPTTPACGGPSSVSTYARTYGWVRVDGSSCPARRSNSRTILLRVYAILQIPAARLASVVRDTAAPAFSVCFTTTIDAILRGWLSASRSLWRTLDVVEHAKPASPAVLLAIVAVRKLITHCVYLHTTRTLATAQLKDIGSHGRRPSSWGLLQIQYYATSAQRGRVYRVARWFLHRKTQLAEWDDLEPSIDTSPGYLYIFLYGLDYLWQCSGPTHSWGACIGGVSRWRIMEMLRVPGSSPSNADGNLDLVLEPSSLIAATPVPAESVSLVRHTTTTTTAAKSDPSPHCAD